LGGVVDGAAAARADTAGARFELGLVDGAGAERRTALSSGVRLEDGAPVRSFSWSKGLTHFPGWWWCATMGRHVGYESWLERDHLMLLDFDPDVTAIASQPFWLYWVGESGSRRHAPDFFARRADGTGVVIDVRADDRVEPRDAEAFAVTARACAEAGWEYQRVGVVAAVLAANVRWLSRYRHPRCAGSGEVAPLLRKAFTGQVPLWAGAGEVGDRLAVLPVLFHLMWRRELVADLAAARLGPSTLVGPGMDRASEGW
jgi:hypothetical protein